MEEKIYKIMRGAGALNIVLGVISLVVGIAAGDMRIISGVKLVSAKSRILFSSQIRSKTSSGRENWAFPYRKCPFRVPWGIAGY